jgi:signal transduction histidine kinase
MGTVLCIGDDRGALAAVAGVLRGVAPVATAGSVAEARAALTPQVAVVVGDQRRPGALGMSFLAEVRARDETTGRILLTAGAHLEALMEALTQESVHRYVAPPWDPRELRAAVRQALVAAEAERERRRLGAAIGAARVRVREIDTLRSRLLAVAAHELRTPLHVLGAALEALAQVAPGGEPACDLLATARRAGEWLGRSVCAMTNLVRLSRPAPLRALPVCLAALARRAAADVAPLCAARKLVLAASIPGAAPARGDAQGLHHALMNLLLNAIRFTPDGGRIRIGLYRGHGRVAVSIADTGVGIPVDIRERIGEPFVTGGAVEHHHSDPIAFQSRGIGLGLAVTRAIAAAHGGRLWFESEEGEGTVFHLEIPEIPTACSRSVGAGGRARGHEAGKDE